MLFLCFFLKKISFYCRSGVKDVDDSSGPCYSGNSVTLDIAPDTAGNTNCMISTLSNQTMPLCARVCPGRNSLSLQSTPHSLDRDLERVSALIMSRHRSRACACSCQIFK